ncbi:MAG: DegT/DnrJ/EryC1/StrS family aminotransferase [Smithella sp.]|jgi:dTDP-4-amino-4,6-dideoxygalactose transaminase
MSIQLFAPHFRITQCLEQIKECMEKGWTGLGFKTIEIENDWKAYTGHHHAHFLSSNTVGLHLAFKILKDRLGWQDGDEIITTPITFVSTNHSILYENLKPIFADVDDYLCLDPASVLSLITPRTRGVIFVGLGGNTGQYEKIIELCRTRSLSLILDAAHMSGTRLKGKHVGPEADVAIYSYHAVKNLPTADSGMVCFANAEDDARARKLSWLGISKDTYTRTISQESYKWIYDVEDIGFKYHGNSIMAAIALVQLRYLDHDNAYRRQLASWYMTALSGTSAVQIVPTAPDCESSRHLFQIRVANRNELMLALHEHQIYPGVHYRDNTEYSMYAFAKGTCPYAHNASQEIISLPLHMGLTRDDVVQVCELVSHFTQDNLT